MQSQLTKALKDTEIDQSQNLNPDEFHFGKFSDKALDFLANSYAQINISHGAVRSSKTINTTLRWLTFLGESRNNDFLQTGKTLRSLHRNVLNDEIKMLETFGIDYDPHFGDGYIYIEDKLVWLMGFNDERVADVIKGMTIGGWYSDETNTYPQSAVEEALDRCSLPNSKVFWTMNPDSPYHYIYTDYITNTELLLNGHVKTWHYVLEDNPNLPKSYIDQIKRRYPEGSVQYLRKILGRWVIAEGTIYDRFIESQHTFESSPYSDYDKYVISSDYGSGNVTVFGLFGIRYTQTGNQYYLLDEFYWDATEKYQLTDYELLKGIPDRNIEGAWGLLKNIPRLDAFITPHDAASLRAELNRLYFAGKKIPVRTYTPDVLDDIRGIQKVIADNRFMINSENCKNSIAQAQSYAWDSKAQARGEDRPLKVDDHCPDMWRGAILGTRLVGSGYPRTTKRYKYNLKDLGKR